MRAPSRLLACLAASALLASPAARAADDIEDLPLLISSHDSGLTLALRVAYAIPLGDYASGAGLSDVYKGAVPVQLDVGWRFDPRWTVAAFFQYGFAWMGSNCPAGADCSARDLRLGAEVLYRILPDAKWVPWAGLGAGYEWATATLGGGAGDVTARGFEFANVQLGLDYQWGKSLSYGPYAAFTVGQFSSRSGTDIADKAIHDWLQLGLKGTFNL
ncbi:hypothetical protein [Anaeromyxobacter paludicola]|uniref:Outer membrane protein beta-barrel domain-containing protein n=1 Tax=Anaeromyxobacter paludicola TaxID=2918171 RepID=A0ABM7X8F5_9BACT|nr:hypothetical protein [Anaeromyxobacter paludicola]BDG08116.1 hypothetical protein AMPC_12290 [Anaeromyxobacter paludicola]